MFSRLWVALPSELQQRDVHTLHFCASHADQSTHIDSDVGRQNEQIRFGYVHDYGRAYGDHHK